MKFSTLGTFRSQAVFESFKLIPLNVWGSIPGPGLGMPDLGDGSFGCGIRCRIYIYRYSLALSYSWRVTVGGTRKTRPFPRATRSRVSRHGTSLYPEISWPLHTLGSIRPHSRLVVPLHYLPGKSIHFLLACTGTRRGIQMI